MEGTPTVLREPPPLRSPSQTFDLGPLGFILTLMALITIPALIYAFFFVIKCPPNPFRRPGRSSSRRLDGELRSESTRNSNMELVGITKYRKDSHVKDYGSECPVCLSVFAEGEEIKQLTVCKHSFHAPCIDMWLYAHSNCPICRASIAVKHREDAVLAGEDDLRQGLPDSANLV